MAQTGEKHKSLAATVSWLMAAKTIGFVFTAALPLLLVRRLNLVEFGNYKQLFLLLGSASSLLPLGTHMSAFYFLPRATNRQDRARIVYYILLFHLFTSALCGVTLILAPRLLQTLFGSAALAASGRLVGLTVIFWVPSLLLESICVANQDSKLAAQYIVLANLMRTALLLGAAIVGSNIHAIIVATALYSILLVLVLIAYLYKHFGRFWDNFEWHSLQHQLSYAIPLGVAGLLWSLQMDLHNYFVSHQFGPALFAIYATGCIQLPLISILSESVTSVLISRVSALQQIGSITDIKLLTAKVMRTLAAVFFPLYAFTTIMATEFITVLYTTRYLPSVPIFRINLLFLPLSVVVIDPIMRAYADQRYFMLRLNTVVLISLAIAIWVGLPQIGLGGTIALVVGSQYVARFIAGRRVSQLLSVGMEDVKLLKDIAKVAVAVIIAAGATTALHAGTRDWRPGVVLCATGVMFGVIYVGMLFMLRVPTAEEMVQMRALFWRTPVSQRLLD